MSKKELIKLFVNNYYGQLEVVGGVSSMTLEAYLRGIMRPEDGYTEKDIQYGLSLEKK
jgi:hypothetical protein